MVRKHRSPLSIFVLILMLVPLIAAGAGATPHPPATGGTAAPEAAPTAAQAAVATAEPAAATADRESRTAIPRFMFVLCGTA